MPAYLMKKIKTYTMTDLLDSKHFQTEISMYKAFHYFHLVIYRVEFQNQTVQVVSVLSIVLK